MFRLGSIQLLNYREVGAEGDQVEQEITFRAETEDDSGYSTAPGANFNRYPIGYLVH